MELKKKLKPRIKARIRKNKQLIKKNIDNFFEWIKGAELVELKNCNIEEDPVRPELAMFFEEVWKKNLWSKIHGRNTCGYVFCICQ